MVSPSGSTAAFQVNVGFTSTPIAPSVTAIKVKASGAWLGASSLLLLQLAAISIKHRADAITNCFLSVFIVSNYSLLFLKLQAIKGANIMY